MHAQVLLPDARRLVCDSVRFTGGAVEIVVRGAAPSGECPSCGTASNRVHSRYARRLADLPLQGLKVDIQWHSRRFFCVNPSCRQRIFTERLEDVAGPHARRTKRLNVVLRAIGLSCAAEEGARLAERLGVATSADTLLRETRRAPTATSAKVRVLGVDDWALRKGQRYGTILVDLEQHRVVDLLPERTSEAFSAWLRTHPEVEIVSRDRGDCYIKGADLGAPQAKQVTDRWHLTHNLFEALLRLIERFHRQLKELPCLPDSQPCADSGLTDIIKNAQKCRNVPTKEETEQCERRSQKLSKYQEVIALKQQNLSQREIARRLGIHRETVQKWLAAGCCPQHARVARYSAVNRWADYLQQRWNAGCHNAVELVNELRLRGFQGSYDIVRRFVAKWREDRSESVGHTNRPINSTRSMAWQLFKSPADREPHEQRAVDAFCGANPSIGKAVQLVHQFRHLLRTRAAESLDEWLERAKEADTPTDLQRFASGLTRDLSAVRAAFSLPWSNGQTEGQVNRLKFIKRQMYGRANFDLLRKRVLASGI